MPLPELSSSRAAARGVRRARNRVTQALGLWWLAISAGGFYNRWSTGLSALLAVFISVPTLDDGSFEGYLKAVAVAAVGWLVLAILLLPAAIAERRMSHRGARAATVLGALVVVVGIRTPLNDWLGVQMWGLSSEGAFGPRVATNLISALLLFSVVAVARDQYAARHVITERLSDALATLQSRLGRARQQSAETRRLLTDTVHGLLDARERMLAGTVDFDAVRSYSDQVRAESHHLKARAHDVAADVADLEVREASPHVRRSLSERLVATPWLLVAVFYMTGTLPFCLAAGGVRVAVIGAVGVVAVDLAAGALVRWAIPPRGHRLRAPLYLAVWVLGGGAVCALAYALLPGLGALGFVAIVAVPGIAVVVALCVDAVHEARAAARRSEALIPDVARQVAQETARAIDPLRQAVDLLHGRVQGRCVVLAAQVAEGDAGTQHVADFRRRTDEAFDALVALADGDDPMVVGEAGPIVDPFSDMPGYVHDAEPAAGPIERILGAWGAVMEVAVRTSDKAAVALADPDVADRVVDIVNEALVNAVKHSGARAALIRLTVAGDGRLRVRAISRGTLSEEATRRAGLGTSGMDVRVTQSGDDVVFDALLPWRDPAAVFDF
ncbi:hypothetical protein RZO50_07190 [Microbacterium sp. SSW1-59]|uniref:hypothetical protein n=1 Tax=Microbacterium xanthum TaxID=3079794 RepID=UPI002AD57255|nr:hypothetical protein [Microbacterium sp. SSW1-59]MDZ8201293.1 hypothetical protein [Microbacterium sp. SSW1-59]